MDTELSVCEFNYYRMRGILSKFQQKQLPRNETCLLCDYQSFIKHDYWQIVTTYITKQPPNTHKQYYKSKYHTISSKNA